MPETLSDAVSAFAAQWFRYLDEHAPSGQLESCLSTTELEMVFPERTLRSVAEFRDWYEKVCQIYTDETHVLEDLTTTADGDDVEVGVVVLWRATQTADDSRLAMRARQTWRLARTATGLVITLYRVDDLSAV